MVQADSKTLLFFGPSGAGKGTQVQLLREFLETKSEHGVVYIEMGALLRGMVAEDTYSGRLTKEVIEQGALMPGFMPVYLTTKHLVENFTGEEHIIADGAVRRPDQATGFDDAMVFYKRENYEIIVLTLSPESIMERLLLRGRNDDTKEAIQNRINWYQEEVEPLLAIFKERGRTIHYIDGEPSIEEVHKSLISALNLS
ncbi:MAG: nucleoside monophosphate kinase [bacterium]|nr:nucleoside monophosphate kinase [bacterium]